MSLLQQALADDHDAWQRIVFLYSPLVETWCRRRNLNEAEIEEVGQKVFTKLLEKLGKFRKDEPNHSFRKWLKTMTGHEVDDFLRLKYREAVSQGGSANQEFLEGLAEDLPSTEADTDEEESERVGVLRRCLELVRTEFETKTFEAFLLVVVDDKPPADVAKVLGMSSTGAVHTAKSRVTRRLRELLEQLEEKVDEM
jgi:RNA polymerase sigma-70 factor (ECF subfamily)